MYYKAFGKTCQPLGLFARGGSVVFKQQAAEHTQTPGLEQGDLFETKQGGHEPVPEPHNRQAEQQAKCYDNGHSGQDGVDGFHFFTRLIS